jgi:hypothetical protein
MDVIKSSRFWICLAIVAGATVALCLKVLSESTWTALVGGLLSGFGVAKAMPGSASSDGGVVKALVPLALVGALLSGCVCSTPRKCLSTCLTVSGTASELAIPAITEVCKAKVKACGDVEPAKCPAYGVCIKVLDHWRTGMADARKILEVLNSELDAAGVK